jgi:hypothetical protein
MTVALPLFADEADPVIVPAAVNAAVSDEFQVKFGVI